MNIELTERQAETIYNALVDAKNVTKRQMMENTNNNSKVRIFQHQLKAIDETLNVFEKIVK